MMNLLTLSVEEFKNMNISKQLNYISQATGLNTTSILLIAISKTILCFTIIFIFRRFAIKEIEKIEGEKPGIALICYILMIMVCIFIWFIF